jgi:flagellin-like hook-associated protein FlgL
VTEDNIAADITFLAYNTYTDGNLTTKSSGGSFVVDPVEEQLEADGWTPIVGATGQVNAGDSYQGVAFYKTIANATEVIIGNRGSQSAHDFLGTLISISPDAEDRNAVSRDTDTRAGAGSQQSDPSRDPANAGPNAGYVYKVHIRTEASHFVVDGEPRPVGAGMTVQADITTDRRWGDRFLSVAGREVPG